jgi:hypothetical protein
MRPDGFEKFPERIGKGRPKGALNIATRLKIMLEQGDEWQKVLYAQIEKAKAGDTRAAEFIANRIEGFPKTTVETTEVPPIKIIDVESNPDIPAQPALNGKDHDQPGRDA